MKHKAFKCGRCGKAFTTHKGTAEHISMKHVGGGEVIKKSSRPSSDEDESVADRAVQAQLDRAMGVYNFDQEWLA